MTYERLLRPRSIAVFGGGMALESIRQSELLGFDGEIWPVHPKKTEILGRNAFRSVEDLPSSPDAAYVGVNRHLTIDIVRGLAEIGAGGAVCFATGFSESGEEGSELEQQLLEASGEMPLLGPNCYGMLNYIDGAALWPDQQGGRRVDEGVAVITMSSNVGFNLTMQRRGLPIAYLVSLGNKLKFDLHDAISALARQERVSALGLYIEAISDPFAFEKAVRGARKMGKPVVAIKAGRSEAAQQIVVSHTASLAGSDELMSALFKRLGIARVHSLEGLMEALKVLHVLGPLEGGRVGATSPSGGDLILVGDAMANTGLHMPPLSEEGVERVRSTVHERVVPANPLDYQMFDWDDEDRMAEKFAALLAEDYDVTLCVLDYPREDTCDQSTWGGAERGFVRAVHRTGAKGAVLASFTDTMCETVAARLILEGIVPLAGIDAGIAGIQAVVDVGTAWKEAPGPPLLNMPSLVFGGTAEVLDEAASKTLLSHYGVPVPASRVVGSAADAIAAADELGYPVVVKALGVAHKTDSGAVRLDLGNADEVSAAMAAMSGLSEFFLVEQLVDGVVAEIIVGVARDEQFGPYLLVGGGGVLVELMRDSVSLLLPTTKEEVLDALGGLACAPLFKGFRGRPRADLTAAADAVTAVARFAEDNHGSLVELDINPLMLLGEGRGVVAADALVRMKVGPATGAEGGGDDRERK